MNDATFTASHGSFVCRFLFALHDLVGSEFFAAHPGIVNSAVLMAIGVEYDLKRPCTVPVALGDFLCTVVQPLVAHHDQGCGCQPCQAVKRVFIGVNSLN